MIILFMTEKKFKALKRGGITWVRQNGVEYQIRTKTTALERKIAKLKLKLKELESAR